MRPYLEGLEEVRFDVKSQKGNYPVLMEYKLTKKIKDLAKKETSHSQGDGESSQREIAANAAEKNKKSDNFVRESLSAVNHEES